MSAKTKLTIELPVEMKQSLINLANAEGDNGVSNYLRKVVRDHLKAVEAASGGNVDELAARARELGVDVREVITAAIASKEHSAQPQPVEAGA